MDYKSKQYTIDYQYYACNRKDSYYNDLFYAKSMQRDTYVVKGYSACDAINKLLEFCKKAARTDVHLLSCEEN